MSPNNESLENLLSEDRLFPPSAEFAAKANAKPELYDKAENDRLAFWDEQAKHLSWQTPWKKTLEWESPFAKKSIMAEVEMAKIKMKRGSKTKIIDIIVIA